MHLAHIASYSCLKDETKFEGTPLKGEQAATYLLMLLSGMVMWNCDEIMKYSRISRGSHPRDCRSPMERQHVLVNFHPRWWSPLLRDGQKVPVGNIFEL